MKRSDPIGRIPFDLPAGIGEADVLKSEKRSHLTAGGTMARQSSYATEQRFLSPFLLGRNSAGAAIASDRADILDRAGLHRSAGAFRRFDKT